MTPWDNIENAFEPMYDECVGLKDKKNDINQTIKCCVMTCSTADVDSDDFMDNDNEQVVFCCRKEDYCYVSKLSRGDTVLRQFGNKTYCVQEVTEDHLLGLIIKVKSV